MVQLGVAVSFRNCYASPTGKVTKCDDTAGGYREKQEKLV